MDHKDFSARIPEYLSGRLDGMDLEEFESHYFECLICRHELVLQRAIRQWC